MSLSTASGLHSRLIEYVENDMFLHWHFVWHVSLIFSQIPKQNTISFIAFQGPNHVHKPTGFIAYAVRLDGRKEIMSIFFKITTQKNRLKSRVECSLLDATVETDEKSNLIITLEPKRVDIVDNNLNSNNVNEAKVEVKDEATMEQEIKELKEEAEHNSEKPW